jgi:hypothetical protein
VPAAPVPLTLSAQGLIIDPSQPSGVTLSQGATVAMNPPGPCALRADQWGDVAPQVTAFACQFYDGTGAPLPLTWINDPVFVQGFVSGIPLSAPIGDPINEDLRQSVHVQAGGQVFSFSLFDVAAGATGAAVFHGGTLPALPSLHTAIEQAYGLTGYTSTGEKTKERAAPTDEKTPFVEEELIPKPQKAPPFTPVTLVIYQDDPGDVFLKDYAEDRAANNANTVAFGANGYNSIINELRRLLGDCKKVSCLILAVHGSPGSFRIGPKGTPFRSRTRVGPHKGQISPQAFGAGIACYLTSGAEIKLLSCRTAAGAAGTNAMQDLADASGASVTASDVPVAWVKRPAPNPKCLRTPTSAGNVWKATPNAPPPVIHVAAPAGNIDP